MKAKSGQNNMRTNYRSVIVGMGEIGRAVKSVVGAHDVTYEVDKKNRNGSVGNVDVMHICFPYDEDFVDQVNYYQVKYEPRYTAIWSTVPIGTTKGFDFPIVHTPVEGRHPYLAKSIMIMPRYIGFDDEDTCSFFVRYFTDKGLEPYPYPSSKMTEAIKLLSTTRFAINLLWADYESRVMDSVGDSDIEFLNLFYEDYNSLYEALGQPGIKRYILTPPGGKIGGHCLIPNAKILNEHFPDEILDRIIAMEDKDELIF